MQHTGHMEIWINPECSKCQTAVSSLDEAGVEYTVRRYLDDPPSVAELKAVVARLALEPWDIVRMNEAIAAEIGLASWERDDASREQWFEAMVANPQLIQRPIITASDSTTRVARDAQSLEAMISAEQNT